MYDSKRHNASLVSFRSHEIKEALAERGKPSVQAAKQLDRYFALLQHGASEVQLTLGEASLLCDLLYSAPWDFRASPAILEPDFPDDITLDSLDREWQVDSRALIRKVESYAPLESAAIIDAVEKFWAGDSPVTAAFGQMIIKEDQQIDEMEVSTHEPHPRKSPTI